MLCIDYYEARQRKNRANSWNDCHSRVVGRSVSTASAEKNLFGFRAWIFHHVSLASGRTVFSSCGANPSKAKKRLSSPKRLSGKELRGVPPPALVGSCWWCAAQRQDRGPQYHFCVKWCLTYAWRVCVLAPVPAGSSSNRSNNTHRRSWCPQGGTHNPYARNLRRDFHVGAEGESLQAMNLRPAPQQALQTSVSAPVMRWAYTSHLLLAYHVAVGRGQIWFVSHVACSSAGPLLPRLKKLHRPGAFGIYQASDFALQPPLLALLPCREADF
jgi:hypothetical protein